MKDTDTHILVDIKKYRQYITANQNDGTNADNALLLLYESPSIDLSEAGIRKSAETAFPHRDTQSLKPRAAWIASRLDLLNEEP